MENKSWKMDVKQLNPLCELWEPDKQHFIWQQGKDQGGSRECS